MVGNGERKTVEVLIAENADYMRDALRRVAAVVTRDRVDAVVCRSGSNSSVT